MKILMLLSFCSLLIACSNESENSETTDETEQISHSDYINSRTFEPTSEFLWSDELSRVGDSTIISVMDFLGEYEDVWPNFGLLDWNDDGYPDLFFEYYGAVETGIKNRIDVHEFDPETNRYKEEKFSLDNPAFFFDKGIITSSNWRNGEGYAVKYQVKDGKRDTLEWVDIEIIDKDKRIESVNYLYITYPMMDSLQISDTLIQLPPEYRYQPIIES